MEEDFDPFDWGGEYTEGSAWQSSFAVPHDIEGLAELYGGKEELIKKLDELFSTPPVYGVGGYEREIHEMSEMAAADFGQCAISNQPSFHIPYIYAALGEKEKTEYWIKRLCEEGFGSGDDFTAAGDDEKDIAVMERFGSAGNVVGVFSLRSRSGEVALDVPDGSYENRIDGSTVTVKNGSLLCEGRPMIFKV